MHRYWSRTLGEEGGRHHLSLYDDVFVLDMHECPSVRLLHEAPHLKPYSKYCEHCRWLYPPVIEAFGYEVEFDIIDPDRGSCRLTVRRPAAPQDPQEQTPGCC